MRDHFVKPIVETLAKRVGHRCSNPACRKRTSGPYTDDNKALRLRFEDETVEMGLGNFVNIPAHKEHCVEWTTDEPTIWLAVFYRT
jgi:hypothetical protein